MNEALQERMEEYMYAEEEQIKGVMVEGFEDIMDRCQCMKGYSRLRGRIEQLLDKAVNTVLDW